MAFRVRSLLPIAALVTSVIPIAVASGAGPVGATGVTATDTFAVIGDIPYGDLQVANFPYVVDQINADPAVGWTVHVGDIKSGSSVCSDEYFAAVRAQFDRFVDPLVYTPGDNEWTDCHRPNNGAYDPLERLRAIRSEFFPVRNRTLGQNPMAVNSQWLLGLRENVRYTRGGATYAAVHVVGSNNGLAPWTGNTRPTQAQSLEVAGRTIADILHIKTAFLEARVQRSSLVVLMMQADMFDPTVADPAIADNTGFRAIVQTIASEASRFRGDVLLLDGDSHVFVDDQPLASGSSWLPFYGVRTAVPNLTRITVEGAADVDEYVRVTVDRSAPRGFTYERVPFGPSPVTSIVVNEAESQNGVPGDWIELANTSDVDLDVSGFVLRDDNDANVATLPAGSIVPANGYLVVEEPTLSFGLGGTDQVRFYAPDGVTLLDSTAYTGHAATTWGRCPDGSGAFQVTSSSTKGAANDCTPLIGINEIESSGGVPGDWVELYNPGPSPSDISGWVFRDNDDSRGYTIPAGTVVAAGQYLVLDESVFGFGLGGADSARLFDAGGALVDSYTWTAHAAVTYGRCPNWVGEFAVTSEVTKGAPNACGAPVTTVKVNEVESSGGVPGDWVELVNTGATDVDLSGWTFRDNDDTRGYAIPTGTVIPAGGYLVLDESQFGFGIGSADSARIFRPDGTVADSYSWTAHAAVTYGRCPDGTGEFTTTQSSTKGAANDCGGPPAPEVVINEVESNGGLPDDWVEVLNIGTAPADLGGWTVRDNNPTNTPYVVPAGTVVAPGEYFILEGLGFGLGGADSVTITDVSGALVDEYSWTVHAATTYGRCPDGTGPFVTTASSTKGAANDCPVPSTTIVLNEVESNGGFPDDWIELHNAGPAPVDVSGWTVLDNDPTHVPYAIPAGTIIQPGAYLVVENFGWGLGSADSVFVSDATGTRLIEYSWTAHALITWGRCPDVTGPFVDTLVSTKGTANACGSPVVINEIESSGGTPGDWVELYNPTGTPTDISGFTFRDSNDAAGYVVPAGTVVPAQGFLVLDESAFGFGLGGADSARLFDPSGALVDSYVWTAHAAQTYGRCPDGTGPFETTVTPTKGSQNRCAGIPFFGPWPGAADVAIVDAATSFTGNMSGLSYQPTGTATRGVLWASQNGPGSLYRLLWNGATWAPDTANGWTAGKQLRFPDGTGDVDAEGVLVLSDSQVYVGAERNNAASGVSRNSVLLFDATAAGTALTATREWNVTSALPTTGANTGIEAVTFVPDAFLVANGFVDQTTGAAYDPANYPGNNGGLFFVGVEATGGIYAFELDHADGTFTLVATIASGFPGVMGLEFDAELGQLWAVCDDTCQGRTSILTITAGAFTVLESYNRPAGMPNLNNEGFAIAPLAECSVTTGTRPVFYADDSDTGGNSLRESTLTCPPI